LVKETALSTEKERIEKANAPAQLAKRYHSFYQGKIEIVPKAAIRSFDDFAIWYTPGVAEPCRAIQADPELSFEYTNRGNSIAIVSDGTRVLGLGNIGPKAGMPVMEGKSLLFKYLGGVDAVPIVLGTSKEEEIVAACRWLEPTFGGINLEDIEKPKCFRILERLRREAEIPVFHDDQQGTASVVTAGFLNALKVVGKKIDQITLAMIGSGAANIAISRILVAAGVNKKNVIMVDSKGILHSGRKEVQAEDPYKWDMCLTTNGEGRTGGIREGLKGVDACIAMSQSGPGVIRKEWVTPMANRAIVFACANPVPEIWPWEALEAGAEVVATGRSDFPNQVNNSLGFPGIFRGTLDVRARTITDGMCIAAAQELAKIAEEKGLKKDYILPTMDDWELYPREAVAVAMKAIEEGVARKRLSREELYGRAFSIIKRAREQTQHLMQAGFIPPPPP